MTLLTREELEVQLGHIRAAPTDGGLLMLIVRRPEVGAREILESATIDTVEGLVGDNWRTRGSSATPDGSADPRAQITVTSWRGINAVAGSADRCPLAGDQLFVDLDLSLDNLPAGTRLSIGTAALEVSDKPHRGCGKFSGRFGVDALRFVNTGEGAQLRLRGINCRVVTAGTVRFGDTVEVVRQKLD